MNLLKETVEDIAKSGHKPEDIIFIGSESSGHCCTWDEFQVLADFEYDAGYGSQEVANDLIVVFSDGARMWRHEYDGSEMWYYSTPFKMPENKKPILILRGSEYRIGWESLERLHLSI